MQSIVKSDRGYVVLLTWLRATFSRRDVLFGLAMAAAIYSALPVFREAFTSPDFSRNWKQDCDLVLIHKGLVSHPRFRDTLDWWTGTWVGQVPFWRPLTSLLFWCEWKLFGWENQDAWLLLNGILHLVAVAFIFTAIEALVHSPLVAAAAVGMFCIRAPAIAHWPVWTVTLPGLAVGEWKNAPEPLLAIAAASAALLAIRGSSWCILPAAAAAGIKETGFAALPATLLIDAVVHRRAKPWWPAALAVLLGLAAYRYHAVGVGYIGGENRAIGLRMAYALLPGPANALMHAGLRGAALLGIGAASIFLLPRRLRIVAALGAVAGAVAANYVDMACVMPGVPTPCAVAAITPKLLWTVSWPAALWTYAAFAGLSIELVLASALFELFAFPCTLAPQVRPHAYYIATAWSAAAVAIAWRNAWLRHVRT